jgi:hypothetical protein
VVPDFLPYVPEVRAFAGGSGREGEDNGEEEGEWEDVGEGGVLPGTGSTPLTRGKRKISEGSRGTLSERRGKRRKKRGRRGQY